MSPSLLAAVPLRIGTDTSSFINVYGVGLASQHREGEYATSAYRFSPQSQANGDLKPLIPGRLFWFISGICLIERRSPLRPD
ncbi:MAG: hypothetical protein LH624_16175 [Cryobacterium sp.]|nr:hypothetical protein [Cryobacterium sp.]